MTTLGVIFPPSLPPERLRSVAVAADRAGLEQLWLWEDCFLESGIATAAAALACTERLVLGIGLLPVPLRNVALAAMELATLERMFPGRLVPGLGHGVLSWMEQVGARAESPMTLLREYTVALRRLLAGETVNVEGRYVHLDDVTLGWPPNSPPPLLIGAIRERTITLAGELGDGVILAGDTTPAAVRDAVTHLAAGRALAERPSDRRADASPDHPAERWGRSDVVVFLPIPDLPPAAQIADRVREFTDVGATHVALLSVGDDPPELEDFVRLIAAEVRPLVDAT